jgi:hypothetical protein
METFEIQLENHTFTFKLLTWKEAIDIESKSYSVIDENLIPNIEKEKRNVLKKALISIQNQENKTSIDIESFFNIKHEIIEKIWQEFYKNNYLTANEAAFYYDAAKRYFNGDNNGPLPPIILEVGLMLKNIISFNRDEFSKISMKEFEIINLVMSLKK